MKDYTFEELYDRLGYCDTHQLWNILAKLGLPYAAAQETEKENLATHEMVTVPIIVPRTDYDTMKTDICVTIGQANRTIRRQLFDEIEKSYKTRKKILDKTESAGSENSGETI